MSHVHLKSIQYDKPCDIPCNSMQTFFLSLIWKTKYKTPTKMCCVRDDDYDNVSVFTCYQSFPLYQNQIFQIDFSQIDFPESRLWIIIPTWEISVKVSTFIPIIVFGLTFNLIIIALLAKNKSLRTPTNLLIANMALADFLTLLIGPILFMVHDFYQNYELGAVGCRLEGFLEGSFLVAAVLNLSAISYDRLSSIVLPISFRMNVKRTKIVMAITWIVGFSFAVPLIVFRKYKQRVWKNFVEKYCKENQHVLVDYWYVLISVLVWLPLCSMVVSYSAIFIKVGMTVLKSSVSNSFCFSWLVMRTPLSRGSTRKVCPTRRKLPRLCSSWS